MKDCKRRIVFLGKGEEVEIVEGEKLTCPICGSTYFEVRNSLLNSRGASLLGLDWADQGATNFICVHCKYIYWFAI
jgi:hypothetical protein